MSYELILTGCEGQGGRLAADHRHTSALFARYLHAHDFTKKAKKKVQTDLFVSGFVFKANTSELVHLYHCALRSSPIRKLGTQS